MWENKYHQWRFRFRMHGIDENYENDVNNQNEDSGDEEEDHNNKVKDIIYDNICIGIDPFNSFHLMGNGTIENMVENKRERYCREIKSKDIVTMRVHCDRGISFGIGTN